MLLLEAQYVLLRSNKRSLLAEIAKVIRCGAFFWANTNRQNRIHSTVLLRNNIILNIILILSGFWFLLWLTLKKKKKSFSASGHFYTGNNTCYPATPRTANERSLSQLWSLKLRWSSKKNHFDFNTFLVHRKQGQNTIEHHSCFSWCYWCHQSQ